MNKLKLTGLTLLMINILLAFSPMNAYAQPDSSKIVRYTSDFSFNDGFFLTFDQVKSNQPLSKSKILTTINYNAPDFFDLIVASQKILFYDNLGIRHEMGIDKIWGYSKNGILYININGLFNRINIVGSICHFIATIKVKQPSYYDPFSYGPYFGGMGYGYHNKSAGYESTEIKQLILDFETGKLYEYSLESLEMLFARDPELYSEFSMLKKRKQKQLKFVYLRKYNEKHPLYFPMQNE